jgi:TolA-binding protein
MAKSLMLTVCLLLAGVVAWAQSPATETPANNPTATAPAKDDAAAVRQEIEQLKKTLAELEKRLDSQEKQNQGQQQAQQQAQPQESSSSSKELEAKVDELDTRVSKAEVKNSLDRLDFSGDYRFEAHTIFASVPSHYDGMALQNLVVRTMFIMPILGRMPTSVAEINNTVAANYANYLQFTNNLTFSQLKQAMAGFPPQMQQQLFGLLMPSTSVPRYQANTPDLLTNRLRINLGGRIADNISFSARLSMYKVFGDSTGVQVFNGQPTSLNIDGTTTGVPNSDQIRVDRAYFSWNRIADSKFYLSIGRRPSTDGPPMNYRNDELRGGTPSGSLIDFQFDGVTLGYNVRENMTWRLCYGIGYESGWGNTNLLEMPQDRLKDTQLLGLNFDLWNTDRTLLQATYAHAFNVTDGFNGLVVLPNNPLTGEPEPPLIMRYTPSANLGDINLFGVNAERKVGAFDLYGSANYSGTRPNGQTTPFGGLMSDPFEIPVDHNGYMLLAGARYRLWDDERTKIGFEFNHGSKYWFNFAQAQDDIIAPKTNTRGDVYETYLTHRISDRFIFKASFIDYRYQYSGSGWSVGSPKALNSHPILGFPTYDSARMATVSIIARF